MTGKLIYAKAFVHDTTIKGIENGQTVANDATRPELDNSAAVWLDQAAFIGMEKPTVTWLRKSVFTCPSYLGGKNWWPIAVDPDSGMAYVPTLHACMTMKPMPVRYREGLPYLGETLQMQPDPASPGMLGSLQAIDLSTGAQVWQHRTAAPWDAGALATAGGVVFSGTPDGHLLAFDAKSGKILWTSLALGSGVIAEPISYEVDGKQYVAVWSGWGGIWSFSAGKLGGKLLKAPRGGRLYVFQIGP
jgi:alcohol dehydrogenase (cytochrome c)